MQKFKPSSAQIEAAENLFIAMAFYQTVKPIYEQMEADLLATGQYHYSEEYYTERWAKRGFDFPQDRIIRNPKELSHMAGLREYNTPEYAGTDSEKYYNELNRITRNAGFVDAENTLCKAENNVIKLENELIKATVDIHKIKLDDIWNMDHRKQLIDLISKLLASFVNPSEAKKCQYYNERITTATINF